MSQHTIQPIVSADPRTGGEHVTDLAPTSATDVARIARQSAAAAAGLQSMGRDRRASMLEAVAEGIELHAEELIAVADAETALGASRLRGEVTRSANQFRLFATAVREGSYLEAVIDHADDSPPVRAPEIRRMLVPLGPVAVFGSSNFPFAFSVLGGDTASALASGCPVVVKAHGSHPLTSALSFEVLETAAAAAGAPGGTVGIVYGQAAGSALVAEAPITAVGFTGSLGAARALQDAIATRPDPIPFYGELSSVNPLIVSAAAASERASAIAEGLFASVTGSAGQLCTKPGVVLIPAGPAGDALVADLADRFRGASRGVLLNARIFDSYAEATSKLRRHPHVEVTTAESADGHGYSVAPALAVVDADALAAVAEECFGPITFVARFEDGADVVRLLDALPGSLATTLHVEEEDELLGILPAVEKHTGRIVFNGFPTGVRVSWGQHHGGPWPATNTRDSSVGVTAMRRFLRPVAWQDAPQHVLPEELRDAAVDVPRRVDGILHLARPTGEVSS